MQFVEPIRYEQPQAQEVQDDSVHHGYGFKRWLLTFAIFAASWYMHSVGAVAYSLVLFLAATVLIIALSIHAMMTHRQPKTEQQMIRHNMLERWID